MHGGKQLLQLLLSSRTSVLNVCLQIHTAWGSYEIVHPVASRECWLQTRKPHRLGSITAVCAPVLVYLFHP